MTSHQNPGIEFDEKLLKNVNINLPAIRRKVSQLPGRRCVKKEYQLAWLLRAVGVIDLTTLSGDDTASNTHRLCHKATHPIQQDWLKAINCDHLDIKCAAVCVYPARVADCKKVLDGISQKPIPIASVATGFPAGQTPLQTRLEEVRYAVEMGASEIDVVINRTLVFAGKWKELYSEIQQMKEACGRAHLKVILATGDLASVTNVYKASMVAMMAGGDFIKTSTGKEVVNATMEVAVVMLRAIRRYHQLTGVKVGFKPAGGISKAKDAVLWMILMKEELGDDWTKPDLFRMGASSLLSDLERQIYHCITGCYASVKDVSGIVTYKSQSIPQTRARVISK